MINTIIPAPTPLVLDDFLEFCEEDFVEVDGVVVVVFVVVDVMKTPQFP